MASPLNNKMSSQLVPLSGISIDPNLEQQSV